MSTLEEKTKTLLSLRADIDKITASYEGAINPLKEMRDTIQKDILEDLKSTGQFSAKFQSATVSRAVRKTLAVIDEKKVIEELAKKGLDKEYTAIQLNDLFYGEFSKGMAKDGIEFPGTAINEKEYISIRAAGENKERRKVATEKVALNNKKFEAMLEE